MVAMDLETMLIGLAIFLLSAALIYLIVAFTMRETTFEQVMEEQKRKQEVQLSRPKEQKKDKKKKFKKGKSNDGRLDEIDRRDAGKEEKMVELEPDPEYIEVSDSGSASTPPKKSKPAKAKPILTNKEEKVLVAKEAPELFHRKNVPKDAVEMKHDREQNLLRNGKDEPALVIKPEPRKVNDSPSPAQLQSVDQSDLPKIPASQPVKKDGSKKKKAARDLAEDVAVVETVEKVATVKLTSASPELLNGCEPPSAKASKKNKQQDFSDQGFMTNEGSSLLASLQLAYLNDADIRGLVEVLVGKLSNPDAARDLVNVDWTKKGQKDDPVVQLRRQLDERNRAFEEEQQRSLAAATKIKDLNQELMNERQKFNSLAKLNQDQKGEIQALQARMQESHVQHQAEVGHYRGQLEAKVKQANDSINQIQNVKEENKILQDALSKTQHLAGAEKTIEEQRQKVAFLDSALQQLSIQLNAADNAKKTSESKAKQFEERVHEMENSVRESQQMAQQYKELSDKLHKSDARLNALNLELRRSEDEKSELVAELKSKEAQMNELNRGLIVTGTQLDEVLKNGQQKEIELQDLKSELHKARSAILEQAATQQSSEHVERAEASHQTFQANDQLVKEKDELMKQLQSQLEDRLKELQSVNEELGSVKNSYANLESEKNSLLKSLQERNEVANEKSFEQNVEVEELRKALTKLESELLSQSQELSRLAVDFKQKESDLERVKHESSSKSQEMSRLVNDLLQKDAEVEKTRNEADALRSDNAVLSECRHQCEELKVSLVSLSEQLLQKEAKQKEDEAHLVQLREKEARWVETEANVDVVNDLIAKIDEKESELRRLNEERLAEESRLRSEAAEKQQLADRYELQLKELKERESEWETKAAGLTDSGAQLQQLNEDVSKLQTELSQVREDAAKHQRVEAELKQSLEESESTLAARDLQLRHLEELNAQVVENELQLMELRQRSSELQKLQERFGGQDEIEARLTQIAEKDEKLAESERNAAEQQAKLKQVEEELAGTRQQLEEIQRHLSGEMTIKTEHDDTDTSPRNGGKSPDLSKHREVTVFTHVQEKASWDMSKLVLDLDTKQAEIQILQSILTQKETAVHELESEKTRLMEMIENMQMELWAKDKQIEAKSNIKQQEGIVEELNEAKQARGALEAEVVHYQTILADTERILKQIENNVDTEEQKWRQKYETTAEENGRLQNELARLKESSEAQSVTN